MTDYFHINAWVRDGDRFPPPVKTVHFCTDRVVRIDSDGVCNVAEPVLLSGFYATA